MGMVIKMVKKVAKNPANEQMKDEPSPHTSAIKIEIKEARQANNRLYLKTVINGKEFMNFDYPSQFGDNKNALLVKIKADYLTLKGNIARCKMVGKKDLLGASEV